MCFNVIMFILFKKSKKFREKIGIVNKEEIDELNLNIVTSKNKLQEYEGIIIYEDDMLYMLNTEIRQLLYETTEISAKLRFFINSQTPMVRKKHINGKEDNISFLWDEILKIRMGIDFLLSEKATYNKEIEAHKKEAESYKKEIEAHKKEVESYKKEIAIYKNKACFDAPNEYEIWWRKIGDASYALLGEVSAILKNINTDRSDAMARNYGEISLNKIDEFLYKVYEENPRRKKQ